METPTLAEYLIAGEEFSPLLTACKADRRRILNECKANLTRKQRELLILRYEEQNTWKQIATFFDVSVPAVWQMHGRARQAMADELARRRIVSLNQIL